MILNNDIAVVAVGLGTASLAILISFVVIPWVI